MLKAAKKMFELSFDNETGLLKSFAQECGNDIKKQCDEYRLAFPSEMGDGHLWGMGMQNGTWINYFKVRMKEDITLKLDYSSKQPLLMMFCLNGALNIFSESEHSHAMFDEREGNIILRNSAARSHMTLYAEEVVELLLIGIDRASFLPQIKCDLEEMPKPLVRLFKDQDLREFFYQSHYSLDISKAIREIVGNELEGIARKAFLEAKIMEIFALLISQYADDIDKGHQKTVLRKSDIALMENAKEVLMANLKAPPTIVQLAKKVGTNDFKLKKGFKAVFGKTINQFLQEERMEKAKLLLAEGSLSISEIANEVGYSSASFFTKLFKKNFGVLPKKFSKNLKYELEEKGGIT